MSLPVYRSIDNLASLTNTNLGLESSRAEDSEHAIQVNLNTYISSNDSAVSTLSAVMQSAAAAEAARASGAESAIAANVASNLASINSLNASRTSDEVHISSNTSAITSLRGSQAIDEAATAAEVARATAAEAALSASVQTHSAEITALQTSVTTGSVTVSGAITAGSITTASLNCVGPITLSSTLDAYGSSTFTVDNTGGCNGARVSTTGLDLADLGLTTGDRQALVRFEARPAGLASAANAASGELSFQTITSGGAVIGLYSGASSSGVATGNFNVQSGTITDIHDQDETMAGSWDNFNTSANVRLVRKGSVVTVSMSSFYAAPASRVAGSTYSVSLPGWALPSASALECCVVVSTNGLSTAGCVSLNASNFFSIFPFNGNWGSNGGLNGTSFSYTV